jgi:pimeloyl-ACP methyl ester carboxylesterase
MTAVFVHGNPETTAVWGPLLAELGRDDVVRLSPPGFGAPLPAGFGATVGEYRAWLVGELEAFDEPVDLVGHDWGGGHVLGVAMTRPDLLRSWVSDVVALYDPDHVWHALAQQWQTPGVGEEAVAARFGADLAERTALMLRRGVRRDIAELLAAGQDETMGRAVLALYRSAVQPVMADLGRDLERAAARPGLAIVAGEDTMVGSDEQRRRSAARAGARTAVLDGLDHWWLLEDPARVARVLREFWASIDAGRRSGAAAIS